VVAAVGYSTIDGRSPRSPEELRRTALLQCAVRIVSSTFRTIVEYPTTATMLRTDTVRHLGSAQHSYCINGSVCRVIKGISSYSYITVIYTVTSQHRKHSRPPIRRLYGRSSKEPRSALSLPLVDATCQSSRYAAVPSRYRLMSDVAVAPPLDYVTPIPNTDVSFCTKLLQLLIFAYFLQIL